MTRDEFFRQVRPIVDSTDDPIIIGIFSREEDTYQVKTLGMDAGDALLVINGLIKKFNLSPDAISVMMQQSDLQ